MLACPSRSNYDSQYEYRVCVTGVHISKIVSTFSTCGVWGRQVALSMMCDKSLTPQDRFNNPPPLPKTVSKYSDSPPPIPVSIWVHTYTFSYVCRFMCIFYFLTLCDFNLQAHYYWIEWVMPDEDGLWQQCYTRENLPHRSDILIDTVTSKFKMCEVILTTSKKSVHIFIHSRDSKERPKNVWPHPPPPPPSQ